MPIAQDKKQRISGNISSDRVLVAEGDDGYRNWLVGALRDWGYEPRVVHDHNELILELESDSEATVILDVDFAVNRLAALGHLLLDGFGPRVIFVMDEREAELSDRALKMGAAGVVERSADLQPLKRQLASVVGGSPQRFPGGSPLLGNSAAIRELRELIRNVAETDAAVMIFGESGTGKELVARAIHDCSRRAAEEFVPVNMAALPESLFESVLFGHEKGAFTGADQQHGGICQHAHEGTLFLDEVGEMNRELQPKLLRFLQNHTVQRVGSTHLQRVDARIVSATNRNVRELVQSGLLREDLFFRLHVIPINVPPLRERRDDIPLLAEAFLERKCQQVRRQMSFSSEVLQRFHEYSWPGNIRQLENLIERMVVMTRGEVIGPKSLPPEWFILDGRQSGFSSPNGQSISEPDERIVVSDRQLTRMESAERRLIMDALHRHGGAVSAAARFLGVGQATIYRKIRSLEIPKALVRSSREAAAEV